MIFIVKLRGVWISGIVRCLSKESENYSMTGPFYFLSVRKEQRLSIVRKGGMHNNSATTLRCRLFSLVWYQLYWWYPSVHNATYINLQYNKVSKLYSKIKIS